MTNYVFKIATKIYDYADKHPLVFKAIYSVLVILAVFTGIFLRALPYYLNGLELLEADCYIEYWQANYVYEKGVLAWYTLTRSNPDTHIFWYPWGRDFITTSYPGLPVFIGVTYHVVRFLGLNLKDWVAITPLVFATFSYITLYLASKELSRNDKFTILAALWIYTLVPATSERSMIGWAEKEGVAMVFIFLSIYFYTKLLRIINDPKTSDRIRFVYAILS
ncbi:MAG: peptide permease, partial [Desulfurococcaceae archaeon]